MVYIEYVNAPDVLHKVVSVYLNESNEASREAVLTMEPLDSVWGDYPMIAGSVWNALEKFPCDAFVHGKYKPSHWNANARWLINDWRDIDPYNDPVDSGVVLICNSVI